MFERFTDDARQVVVQAQAAARGSGTAISAVSTCCWPRPPPVTRRVPSCATRA